MGSYRVTCHKPDISDRERRMKGVGGPGWYRTVDQIISLIRAGERFYTQVNGVTADVVIAQTSSGRDYIKTSADGYGRNNLLELPPC
ncbi:DUF3892 domain-containing protein [Roseibium sp.]|uniref:DUF3892 domain-containing protein n=1 Tax=Roseibium sp. TaxID=1936156 RepID=UPI003B508647